MESADDIFLQAREITGRAARAAYLANACGCDHELRHHVEMMLRDADAAQEFFGRADKVTARETTLSEGPGIVIDRYKLLEKIGEGGMGVVYMAQQREPVVRKVALKIIKAGMDTRQVIARFEAERQALALMDHPNIAKVLDGGATEAGRPYFVMDLVQGLPMTQFCDEAKLSTRERLELFLDVCSAIQHAHQKGIIHRDIKPSNILVTLHGDKPVPKVIDFGIAKATQQPLTDKSLFTQFQSFIGTPAYMSPEQASLSGLDIDTRSDIYALGVLLYELLTGKTPFDGKELLKAGLDEMRRTIKEKEPLRPSTRLTTLQGDDVLATARCRGTDALKLVHQVRGDLDWIVMKCLEKDRARRYETANGLVADIKHHLNNEPVLARPPSKAYRFQKLVRRNKLQFAAVGFAFSVLIAAVAVSSWQAVKARRERQTAREQAQLAKQQAEIAQAVKEFLTENLLGGQVNPLGAPESDVMTDEARRALVSRVARQIDGSFTNQPLIEAEIRIALMKVFTGLNDYANVATQSEKVVSIQERLLGRQHSDTLGAIASLAYSKYQLGHKSEAFGLLADALARMRSSTNQISQGAGVLLHRYGLLLIMDHRPAEAVPYLKEALAILKQLDDPKRPYVKNVMGRLTQAMEQAGQVEEAETLHTETLRQCEQDHGPEHAMTVQAQFGLGRFFVMQKRWAEGLPLLEKAVAFNQQRLGTNHLLTLDAQYWLGQAWEQKGDIEGAAKLYADVHLRCAKHLPYNTARFCCTGMADFFVRHRRYEDAKAVFESLRVSFEKHSPERSSDFASFIRATAATKGWQAAGEICRKQIDQFADDPSVWRTKATVLLYSGDATSYGQALAKVLSFASGAKSWKDRTDILNIALLGATVLPPEQLSQCEALIQSLERGLDTATEQQQDAGHLAIGGILFRLGRLTNSLEHLDQAAQKYPSGTNRARVLLLKSLCLHGLGRVDDARATFDEAEAIMQLGLLERLKDAEGFLAQEERTCVILRREAHALLGPK